MKNSYGEDITHVHIRLHYWSSSTGNDYYTAVLHTGNATEPLVKMEGVTPSHTRIPTLLLSKGIMSGKLPKTDGHFSTWLKYGDLCGIKIEVDLFQVKRKKDLPAF